MDSAEMDSAGEGIAEEGTAGLHHLARSLSLDHDQLAAQPPMVSKKTLPIA